MKKNTCLAFFIATISLMACAQKPDSGLPDVNFKDIEKNFMQWWTYQSNNIVLSSNFIAIDDSSKIISKGEFLKKLTSGDFIPLKLISEDSISRYKLFKLDQTSDADIRSTIKNTSYSEYLHFKMEGKNFPKFNFKDINGIEFNNENTKGKIVIVKCWFIACHACVAEFPELNELVLKYPNRNDILFISLALDSKEKLNQFLSQKKFNYAVVSDQEQFINNELGIRSYPTHLIVDRSGKIIKVVSRAGEMISALKGQEFLNANR
ncbi:MAG: TlpA family protein disulfide reductase [Prolixibacteraceae bacterium]|jgi:peroxiredoxin|nr:TlpA family protein disulfide reductase [Prolixibacteraceae bacterium]